MTKSNVGHLHRLGAPLLWRVLVFLGIFGIAASILGPQIIGAGYVNRDGFVVYGWAGKGFLFAVLTFIIMVYRQPKAVKLPAVTFRNNALGTILVIVAFARAWIGISTITHGTTGWAWPLQTHVALIGLVAAGALAVFGWRGLRNLYRAYKRELGLALGIGIGFVGFLAIVYGLWHVLATTVLHAVAGLMHLSGLSAVVVPPQVLLLSKFGIAITQYCSGIDSIALFGGLYILIGVMDWAKLNKTKFLATFLPAVIVLFGLNIIRVYVLILAGYYINPHIAFSLFHTYAGMIFFILYSALFWWVFYSWMLLQPAKVERQ